jgi:large subunit ribosomal protein L18
MARKSKLESRKTRHHTLRKRIRGTSERPRLVVFRSARHIYAQIVDDLAGKTLVAAGDLAKKKDAAAATAKDGENKKDKAKQVGVALAKACLAKGISKVVFDRAGYKYHGRVSAVAAGAREGGLQF